MPPERSLKPKKHPQAPTNPEQRIVLVNLLDRSQSMGERCPADPDDPRSPTTTPIAELNAALPGFQEQCAAHALLRLQLEVAHVAFSEVIEAVPFKPVAEWRPPTLTVDPGTALGQALNVGLDLIVGRLAALKDLGIPVRHSFLVALTDGEATDDPAHSRKAVQRIRQLEEEGGFSFFPVGVNRADLERLAAYSHKRKPLLLKGLRFTKLFDWLLASIRQAAASRPGEAVRLSSPVAGPANPDGWAELR